ncbi:MAG: hypothetical protein ACKVT2_04700 [Saprospiraceae bacterium]
MKTTYPYFLSVLMTVLILSQSSCAYYQRYQMSKSKLQKINPDGLSVYLVDASHPLTRGWYVSEPKFEKNSIRGYLTRMAEVETLEASMLRNRSDAQQSRNDILLFAKPQFAAGLPDTATMVIQNSNLEKIEVCELNHGKTIGLPLLGCFGGWVLVYLITEGI